jgi:hypothetical protein
VPAGTAVRFEPGDRQDIALVALGGSRRVTGLNGLTNGSVDAPSIKERAAGRLTQRGFGNVPGGEVSNV